jgi:hypothetical protein
VDKLQLGADFQLPDLAGQQLVAFVPYVIMLNLAETSVMEQHWSVRQQKATTQEREHDLAPLAVYPAHCPG